jgi:hypothetical protein
MFCKCGILEVTSIPLDTAEKFKFEAQWIHIEILQLCPSISDDILEEINAVNRQFQLLNYACRGWMGSKVSYCWLCWKISIKTAETTEIFQNLQISCHSVFTRSAFLFF